MPPLHVSSLLQEVLGGGSSLSPPMQTLNAAAQLTAPLLTMTATLSLHMDSYERTVAFVGQWTAYTGGEPALPLHTALNDFPSWTSRPSQLTQWPLITHPTLSPCPPDPCGWLDRLGLGLEPPRSRGRLGWAWVRA